MVQACNAMAMDNLAGGDLVNALVMLQRAESWTDPDIFMRHDGMRVLTYNNYACYYKREGNLKLALRYLRKAAALGTESSGIDNLSVTYLNLCAVLSQMGKYVPGTSPFSTMKPHSVAQCIALSHHTGIVKPWSMLKVRSSTAKRSSCAPRASQTLHSAQRRKR